MDAVKKTWNQFRAIFVSLTPSQRLTLLAVPAVLLATFAALIWQNKSAGSVPLSWGKVFTIEQLRSAEQTLIEAGLTDFHTEGQRIFVPSGNVEKYNAALLVDGNLPDNSLSEFERQFEKTSVFSSREQLQTMKEIALRNELRHVLRAVPEIDDATVTWARSEGRRWPERSNKVTATVSLQPRRGRAINAQLVRSVRTAVSSMIPDLAADDVTVFDQASGTAYTAERDDVFDSKILRWIDDHTEHYHRQIAGALSYIPEVIISVSVDIENLKSQIVREQKVDAKQTVTVSSGERTRSSSNTERSSSAEPGAVSNQPRQLATASPPSRSSSNEETDTESRTVPSFTISEKEFLSAMPQAVQVSVSIPESYYRQVALAQGIPEGTTDAEKTTFKQTIEKIRTTEEEKVKLHALTLIPAGSPPTAVHVASVTRIAPEQLVDTLTFFDRLKQSTGSWAGPVALALLAAWGLLMLGKSSPKTAVEEEESSFQTTIMPESNAPEESPPLSRRDSIQLAVKDNPEIAAAVLSKWLQTADR